MVKISEAELEVMQLKGKKKKPTPFKKLKK